MGAVFLYFEYLGALVRIFVLNKLGLLYANKIQKNKPKRFYWKGNVTYYMHTIWSVKPNYVERRLDREATHYYRMLKDSKWKTIKSKTKLK